MLPTHNANGKPKIKGLVDRFGNPLVNNKAETRHYQPLSSYTWGNQVRDLPLFTFLTIDSMLVDQTIQLGLAMRLAPLLGVEFAYKQGNEWVPGIKSDDKKVADFVERQLHKIWRLDITNLLNSQIWGWAGAEVMYKVNESTGMVEYNGMLHRHPRNVRALGFDGELVGVQFSGVQQGETKLGIEKSLFHAHNQIEGSFYGQSILRGAYSAWADKWLEGGALDVRRLYMHADAYGGKRMRYPPGTTEIDGFGDVPNRDIAREIVEQAKSGEVMVLPSTTTDNGKFLWDIEDVRVGGQPTHILQYPKDLDVEMLRGLAIPDDFLISGGTGAWQGKQVPMQAFYTSLTLTALNLLRTIQVQILEQLVRINWGENIPFECDIKPIEVQMMEMQNPQAAQPQAEMPGQEDMPGGFGEFDEQGGEDQEAGADPMGGSADPMVGLGGFTLSREVLAEAIGNGLAEASQFLEAAKQIGQDGRQTEYDYSSTQFNLPPDITQQITSWAVREIAPSDLLTHDSIERDSHVTVLYGIEDDNVRNVEYALRDVGPIAVQLGRTNVFTNDDNDVLYVEIHSQTLHAIRMRLMDVIPNFQTHPQYNPHATIAKLKAGAGCNYCGNDSFEGEVVSFNRLQFCDRDGGKTDIHLAGPIMFGRAPSGGIAIDGTWYMEQTLIPSDVMQDLSDAEYEAVC